MNNWRRILFVTSFAQVITAVGMSLTAPFLPLYIESLGSSSGLSVEILAGLVFSVQGFTMMFAAPVWGVVADRHGRKLMLGRALFGGAILLLLMGFARSAEDLVVLRALQGLVTGTAAASNALVAASVPRERLGVSMGILQVGLRTGISIGPLLGGVLADAFGYHMPFFVTAGLLTVSGILVWRGIEEHFEPKPVTNQQHDGFIAMWRHALALHGVPQALTIRFLTGAIQSTIVPIAPLFLLSLLPEGARVSTFTGLTFGVSALASTVSALYFGRLGDRIGHRRVVIISGLIFVVAYLAQALSFNQWSFFGLQALSGVALGGMVASLSALLAHYAEEGEEGTIFGLENSMIAGGRAFAPLLGSVLAVTFGYRGVFAAAGLIALATTLVAVFWLPKAEAVGESHEQPHAVRV